MTTLPQVERASDEAFQDFWQAALSFTRWLNRVGYSSYDPYDVWGTRYAKWARRLYYAGNPAGIALTAPIIFMELTCPRLRGVFVEKQRFATADAQVALAFLNLHELTQGVARNETPNGLDGSEGGPWLSKARVLAQDLLSASIPGYSGHCWGYPFDWQNINGLMPKGTPHITATPYCYEAFARLFDLTGEGSYLEVARSTASFVFSDLNDTPIGLDVAAGSYSPRDFGKVVNANAYRAFVLFDAARRFSEKRYEEKAWKNLRFILRSQRDDGSWLYAIDSPKEAFIDHFHTCFVLKNLWKLNRYVRNEEVARAIRNGYSYYRKALFDSDGNPRSFALAPRLQIVRLEMYNFAEAITLGSFLKDEIPESFELACRLASQLVTEYQLPDGYFITRVYSGGIKHKLPFLRWPQAQLFYAITNLLCCLISKNGAKPQIPLACTPARLASTSNKVSAVYSSVLAVPAQTETT